MTRRPWALVAAGLAAAVLADLSLAGAARIALESGWLLSRIDGQPESLFVAFRGPRVSLVPGRLAFSALTVRSRDPNVEWEARLENVTVDVSLLRLPLRRFQAAGVRAESLSFRLRERLGREHATPARLARYPPIAGFPDPPLLDVPSPRTAPAHPWRVVLEDLRVARVREIWIGSWRWTGEARLAGGFFLRPGSRAEVFPSELDVGGGTLAWGPEPVSRGTRGFVRASLPRFDTHAFPGNDVWKIVSGSARLTGTLDSLAFLAPGGASPVAGGAGEARLAVLLAEGQGRARLTATAGRVVARVGPRTLRGAASASIRVPRVDFHARQAAFDGTCAEVRGVRVEDASGPAWSGAFAAPRARLSFGRGDLDVRLAARLGDARPLVALLPSGPPRWAARLLRLHDLEARARLRAADGLLALSPGHAEGGSFSLDGDVRAAPGIRWGALLVRKNALAFGVGLEPGGGTYLRLSAADAWFEAEGRPGGLRTPQARAVAATRRAR